ncbi:MAG: methylated-DNA--[protein]-cysteine S-methyltransferase [Candidatus Eisenbacteria bacterium]|uniref:methylated-DNA--[protein]-cysteine S-methyltransferase n=1 Tax=Eiseniibacteriota bacterium TaxID=2212470 RepID=A0A7Y2H466_UNCEI|nr:methylated-DNA--[protein]-cysteine S-methyltransferase [Candidatus Eisenbacteria bacterium]
MSQSDYDRMAKAIAYIEDHQGEHPTLTEVSEAVGLSPSHFQRVFQRWAGLSPKRYLQVLALQRAKLQLRHQPLLEAAMETGLSSPGRLHDLFVTLDAVTPGEFKNQGRDLQVRYGMGETPFGSCLVAFCERGITNMHFSDFTNEEAQATLREDWPEADLISKPREAKKVLADMFDGGGEVRVFARGTNFQTQVWRALLRIPCGQITSYEDVAKAIGRPSAVRAVASAVGRNPIAFLIPCHRVLRKSGALGGYRWGLERKKAMLAWEFPENLEADAPLPTEQISLSI